MCAKKVLFITYYWPPSGGSGVQRPLKFVKYLRHFGWEPIVYTVSNGEYPAIDESLESDIPSGLTVIKRKIWEPYSIYKLITGKKKEYKITPDAFTDQSISSWKKKLAIFIRSNFFIPDPRIFWVRPSVRFLKKYLKQNKVDAIISTGPPHSMHLIARKLKKKMNIPWIADFRDPWTTIDYAVHYSQLKCVANINSALEKKVIRDADILVTVSSSCKKSLQKIDSRPIEVITNGFDEEDILPARLQLDKKFSLVYVGVMNYYRNHSIFWQAIDDLIKEDSLFAHDISIKLYGKIDQSVNASIQKYNLQKYVDYKGYVDHREAIRVQSTAQVLYLSITHVPDNAGIVTGKLFEYLAAGRPILCIGSPFGDAAWIIKDAMAGYTVDFFDKENLKNTIRHFYTLYRKQELKVEPSNLEKYSRKTLTQNLAQLLESIVINKATT